MALDAESVGVTIALAGNRGDYVLAIEDAHADQIRVRATYTRDGQSKTFRLPPRE